MRSSSHVLRAVAAAAAFALALTACGQKEGVHNPSIAQGGDGTGQTTTGGSTTGDATTSDGTTTDPDTGTTTGETTTGGTTSGGTTTGGGGSTTGGTTDGGTTTGGDGDDGGSAGGSDGGTGQQATPQGSDRTGVSDDAIHLAVHAPVTGAAPLPTTSFEKARDTYWRFLEASNTKVLGRNVTVEFKDDKYDPNSARQACRELASRTFTIVGGGGTDQIQACGQFAGVAEFPYFSAGVTEKGLTGNPWYFASSMTYKQQGPLLAQYVKKNHAGQRVAMIVTDTPNFDDAIDGWMAGVQQQGLDYYDTLKHPKGDTSWYNSFASKLASENVEVVYILSSPVDYIRFAQQAAEQSYTPQFVGVGITMGLNAVLDSGCDQVGGGVFLSPFPGLDVIDQLDPDFRKASGDQGAPADDIALALWGIAKQQHVMFTRYQETFGNDLTREDFRSLAEQMTNIETNVFPAASYSSQNHFGGQSVHVLQADCGSKTHKTLATFVSSF